MPIPTCPNGAGSINNTNEPDQQPVIQDAYVPPNLCVGEWTISNPDECSDSEYLTQQSYVAETLNISGAPVNVYRLLGIHEQGIGSLLPRATLISSPSVPLFGVGNLNVGPDPWRSAAAGSAVVTTGSYVGADFGNKVMPPLGNPQYAPTKPNWQSIAAVSLRQADTATNFARQVRIDVADGETTSNPMMYTGAGNGTLTIHEMGELSEPASISIMATAFPAEFLIFAQLATGANITLGVANVGALFESSFISLTINVGTTPFLPGDLFTFTVDYVWKRAGVFNLVQSASAAVMSLNTGILAKAIRVTPTLYTATGPWEVLEFDVLDSAPTDVNNIQDLFFNENRDRDYAKVPLTLKCQYTPNDGISDLAKFGINILDQYLFTTSFVSMTQLLGRPLVTGDIIELPAETQYDQNLRPIRKFLEVTDTGWASEGFSTSWRPTVFRFSAQQALPSQETRDIFGTIDTQKYFTADQLLVDGFGEQIDITPLTQTEEIIKAASNAVPETGDDTAMSTAGQPTPIPPRKVNAKPEMPQAMTPAFKNNIYIEDGLPPNGEAYGEGYALPDSTASADGDYFRLNYPNTEIPARLYRFSTLKNRWIFIETDRRGAYSSHKPSVRKILESGTQQGLKKKQI